MPDLDAENMTLRDFIGTWKPRSQRAKDDLFLFENDNLFTSNPQARGLHSVETSIRCCANITARRPSVTP